MNSSFLSEIDYVTCNNCGNVVKLRSEFCPICGQRMVHTMDDIIASSQDDAARREGEALIGKLRAGIAALLILFSVVLGVIYLYDKKLTFDGSALPGFQANAPVASGAPNASLEKPYVDPRPLPPLPTPVVRVMGHRLDPVRAALRSANGGGAREFNTGINAGLQFLSKWQEKDGGWPVSIIPGQLPQGETADFKWGRVGVSSLVLLAYLGDGHTWVNMSNGGRDQYAEIVRRGIAFLLTAQDPATGRFGAIKREFMYNHSMATLALVEAAALTGDAELKARATKAVDFLVQAQTTQGGWEYYGRTESDLADISSSAWPVQALAAARDAQIAVPDEAFSRVLQFYRKSTQKDRAIYRLTKDDGVYLPSRSGMVLMSRLLCGESTTEPDIAALSTKLLNYVPKVKPEWGRNWNPKAKDAADRAAFNPYMLYFCTYGMFFAGGKEWTEWNEKTSRAIFDMQDGDGAWRANDVFSGQGGTCYSTAMCVLSLQVHHRIIHSVASKSTVRSKDE